VQFPALGDGLPEGATLQQFYSCMRGVPPHQPTIPPQTPGPGRKFTTRFTKDRETRLLMTENEQASVMTLALLAAAADGTQSVPESAQLQDIAREAHIDLARLSRQVSGGQLEVTEVARQLKDPEARDRAYQAALLVCSADGPPNPAEEKFLGQLRIALGLSPSTLGPVEQSTRALALAAAAPAQGAASAPPTSDATLDEVILKQAMLTGALELLPDQLASLAILPLQLRLVYQVGQHYGQQLDTNQVKDLAGTLGLGAAAHLVEGVVRRVLGGLTSGVLGGLLGGATGLAAGVALSFASTYALGHVAKQYYAQGRRLSAEDLRNLFLRFQGEAKDILPRVEQQIQTLASGLKLNDIVEQLRPQ
jgi:tellurite resistance protein/uncharacterized protein (DUF697 family)